MNRILKNQIFLNVIWNWCLLKRMGSQKFMVFVVRQPTCFYMPIQFLLYIAKTLPFVKRFTIGCADHINKHGNELALYGGLKEGEFLFLASMHYIAVGITNTYEFQLFYWHNSSCCGICEWRTLLQCGIPRRTA